MAYTPKPAEKEAGGEDTPTDFIATARKRLQTAIDAFDDARKDSVDDFKFAAATPDNGWQWPEQIRQKRLNDPNGARPCLTINKLPQHIKLVTNEQRQNRPAIKVIPVDDKADVDVAEILNGVVRHIEANSDADIAYDVASENQVIGGEGYIRILTDYVDEESVDDEQDILIRSIKNPFSVYLDPDGLKLDPTGRYCMWGFITDRITKDEFKDRFPDAKETNWELLGTGDQAKGWVDGDYITIAEYFCVEVTKVKTATRTITQKKVMWSKLSPLEKLEEREWAGKFIPIVRVVGNEYEVDGKLVISGLVRNSKDACRMFNYWTSQEAEILALAPKAPFIGGKGQFEGFEGKWGSANTVNYPYLEYNPVTEDGVPLPPPQRTAPPLPPAGFMNAKLAAADDIQSTVGQYNPSLGAESKEKSGKAIVARQRQADVGTFHYVDNLGRAVRQVGRIVVDLIPKIYDTQRVARIIGEDGTPDHVTLNPDQEQAVMEIPGEDGGIEKIYNPTIGRYDVRVTTGPSYTTKRQEAAEFMAQVLQGNKELMAVMGDLYFRMLDVPGAEEIAERLKKTLPPNLAQDDDEQEQEPMVQTPQGPIPASQAGQLIVGLMEQNQQAQQSMQTVQQEAQKVHDEATTVEAEKKELQAIQKEIQAAQRELALKEDLALERIKVQEFEAQNKVREQGEAFTQAQQAKQEQEPQAQPMDGMAEALTALAQAMVQQNELLASVVKMSSQPRETELVMGEDGMPARAISRPVLN